MIDSLRHRSVTWHFQCSACRIFLLRSECFSLIRNNLSLVLLPWKLPGVSPWSWKGRAAGPSFPLSTAAGCPAQPLGGPAGSFWCHQGHAPAPDAELGPQHQDKIRVCPPCGTEMKKCLFATPHPALPEQEGAATEARSSCCCWVGRGKHTQCSDPFTVLQVVTLPTNSGIFLMPFSKKNFF